MEKKERKKKKKKEKRKINHLQLILRLHRSLSSIKLLQDVLANSQVIVPRQIVLLVEIPTALQSGYVLRRRQSALRNPLQPLQLLLHIIRLFLNLPNSLNIIHRILLL